MKIEQDHRLHAVQMAGQLPSGRDDALAVLDCLREIIAYVHSDAPTAVKAPIVT
jgi:hypothetical protein